MLITDVIVHPGQNIVIRGNGNTVVVGATQLQVLAHGELHLEQLTLAESTDSSAVIVNGRVFVRSSTVCDCALSSTNYYGTKGAVSAGAAFFVLGGELEIVGTGMTA